MDIEIRRYRERDAQEVGKLIADTYGEFNLSFVPPAELGLFLGPFRYARSVEKAHQEAIAQVVRSAMVYVAEADGEIVGVLRGRKERLGSLIVRGDDHRQGIGRRLVERSLPLGFGHRFARQRCVGVWAGRLSL
jgi:predicted N-acetyltransferase YhbS